MRFKNFERKSEGERLKRIFASGELGLLRMVSEPDIGRCASEDGKPRRKVDTRRCAKEDIGPRRSWGGGGVDCDILHRLEREKKHWVWKLLLTVAF